MERLEVDKYSKWYWAIIDKRKGNAPEGYSEKHHIVPRSFGGGDLEANLVRLTAREHFICHLLLTKMFQDDKFKTAKMVRAWCWMAWGKNNEYQEREYRVNGRIFEKLRKEHSKIMSESQTLNNSQAGTKWVYNELTQKCKKIPKYLSEDGWEDGRVLNWENHFKRVGKPKNIKHKAICRSCEKEYETYRSEFCSRECGNKYRFHKSPKMITMIRDGAEKEVKSMNVPAYRKIGWERIDKKQK
tara:strand:- start:409 stop:1137 length:729 start_codon:yes stop_codon:yes gene_type:complete